MNAVSAAVFDPRLLVWLVAALAALLVLGLIGWLWKRRPLPGSAGKEDRLDTLTGWPPQVTRLLTQAERVAFGTLVRALPEYVVLAQVPLARFIDVPKRNSYAEWLRRAGHQSIDFLICDATSQVVAVVDVQMPTAQTSSRASRRQVRIARILKAAKVPLHVWLETSLPPVELARDGILGTTRTKSATPGTATADREVPLASAAVVAAPTSPAGPVSGVNPFDESGRDSTQDEFIEAQEPPPTTWYDDLDSGPTPLASNKRPRG